MTKGAGQDRTYNLTAACPVFKAAEQGEILRVNLDYIREKCTAESKCCVPHLPSSSYFNLNLQNCRTFKAVKITFKKCLQFRFTKPALIELSNC
ncbi:hypothetical protein CDAR_523761 [Caerostris darwini]|uniref:Uncharacterized protein n=1 Tax=Caerostris darwini TaxID=1538125 RepID=A0AAV4TVU7_9ARAC|nr:hypothetical protein CDAR_523761 [Caerostris darwini]